MPKFAIGAPNDDTTTGQTTSLTAHANATGEQGECIEAIATGSEAAAADRQHTAGLLGSDGAGQGTGTAETPEPFNSNSAASAMACLSDCGTEPTVMAVNDWVTYGFNQRGGMRWAVPRGEGAFFGHDFAEDTLNLRIISDAAGNINTNIHWWEA